MFEMISLCLMFILLCLMMFVGLYIYLAFNKERQMLINKIMAKDYVEYSNVELTSKDIDKKKSDVPKKIRL